MKRFSSYVLLFIWTAAASVLHLVAIGLAPPLEKGAASMTRAAIPDFATILLVAAAARLARRDLVRIAFACALGRIAFTSASPMAVLSGCTFVALVADSMRRFAELDRASLRLLAAGIASFVYSSWLMVVDLVRYGEARSAGELALGAVDASDLSLPIVTATTSAVCAAILWPLFTRLPGLARLERRAF